MEEEPGDVEVLLDLGAVLLDKLDDHDGAAEMFGRVCTRDVLAQTCISPLVDSGISHAPYAVFRIWACHVFVALTAKR